MSILNWFVKKDKDFYAMLKDQADKTVEGMKGLLEFLNNPTELNAEKVVELEQEADDLRAYLIHEINDSFVTPIDREDIFELSNAVDEIIDYAKKTVHEIKIYQIVPSKDMIQIGDALLKATIEIAWGIKNLSKDLSVASDHAKKARKLENHIEYLYHSALSQLFASKDMEHIFKMREVYRHLSNSADKCVASADIIYNISIKES